MNQAIVRVCVCALVLSGVTRNMVAMAEIIHDIAPGVELAFEGDVTLYSDLDRGFEFALRWQPDIILYEDQPFGGTTLERSADVAIVADAAATGTLVITNAGQYGKAHYRAPFVDDGEGYHSFAGSRRMKISLPMVGWVSLCWTFPPDSKGVDRFEISAYLDGELDTRLSDSDGKACMDFYVGRGQDELDVRRLLPTENATLDLIVAPWFGYVPPLSMAEPNTPRSSVVGVAALAEVFTIGALDAGQPLAGVSGPVYAPRAYSSHGPGEFLVPTTITAAKPDVAALDCQSVTDNASPGAVPGVFCGTWASSAVVAGIAALLQEHYRFADRNALETLLMQTADLVPGFGSSTGAGQVNVWRAYRGELVPICWPVFAAILLVCPWLLVASYRGKRP